MRTVHVVDGAARVGALTVLFVLGGALLVGLLTAEVVDWVRRDR